ncbi:MAG: SAM-dependent methyltransferase, partial [Anaerolineaceae bacterium]|nr:SAM-dependent methyltransferase [Anaerolineaceae bacterium]
MERFYPESKFGGFTRIDGTIAFYTRVQALIDTDCVVIDFGCGRGAYADDPVSHRRSLRIFQGKARRVIGLDASS